jgi:Beta-lactamase
MSEVVFDYVERLVNYAERRRAYLAGVAARTASLGEPWISFFDQLRSQRSHASTGSSRRTILASAKLPVVIREPTGRSPENGPEPHVMRAHRIHRSDFGSTRRGPRFLRNAQERSRLDELDLGLSPGCVRRVAQITRFQLLALCLRTHRRTGDWLPQSSNFHRWPQGSPSNTRGQNRIKKKITVQHLLDMASGIAWVERLHTSDESLPQMYASQDPTGFVLDQSMSDPPGEKFSYKGGDPYLLSALINKLTGQKPSIARRRNEMLAAIARACARCSSAVMQVPNINAAATINRSRESVFRLLSPKFLFQHALVHCGETS